MKTFPESRSIVTAALWAAAAIASTSHSLLAANGTGGNAVRVGEYVIHTFTGNGTFTLPEAKPCDVLIVGGGGGGAEGGGGGGGFLSISQSFSAGSYSVVVGAGGAGGTVGYNGGNSVFGTHTAYGGGRGGGGGNEAGNGGSGGGARRDADGGKGQSVYNGQGYDGGDATAAGWCSAGGGGGAGGVGGNGNNIGGFNGDDWESPDDKGGNGGIGRASSITGSSVYYGGGGGGTNTSGYGTVPTGGAGGGGAGSQSYAIGGTGVNGLGGGGGARASGGSGIVIVRYYSPSVQQTINFTVANQAVGNPPVTLGATATSGMPVSYTLNSGPATLSGNTLTLTGAIGTVSVTASQPGDLIYGAAAQVTRTFTVKNNQTITFSPIDDRSFGSSAVSLSASSSSGLPVTFAVSSGPGAVSGNSVVTLGAGTITVTASQVGNGSYNAAPPVNRSFQVFRVASPAASGGTTTRVGDYLVHTFLSNGVLVVPSGATIPTELLLVGGGGGGAQGGGGGGGVVNHLGMVLGAGNHAVSVGSGGTSYGWGGNSSIAGVIAYGGGRGGEGGASGGGAHRDAAGPGGAALYGGAQGYPGGGSAESSWSSAGGGGGAGGPGQSGGNAGGYDEVTGQHLWPDAKGGDGGVGRAIAISGSTVYYGGGGGGTNESGEGALPAGGLGGGGAGSKAGATGGTGSNGLGGGGGAHAAGGSGVVIVKYFSPLPDTQAPTTPSNLILANQTASAITVSWGPSADDFAGLVYDVYRTRSGVTNRVATVSQNVTSYADMNIHPHPDYVYQYTVRARDVAGNNSGYSNAVTATALPPTDSDSDGVPDALEVLFGTQAAPPAVGDTNLALKPHRPIQ